MSARLLVYCVGVATRPGFCQIAQETAEAAPTLCTEYGTNGWMDGWMGEQTLIFGPYTYTVRNVLIKFHQNRMRSFREVERICGETDGRRAMP